MQADRKYSHSEYSHSEYSHSEYSRGVHGGGLVVEAALGRDPVAELLDLKIVSIATLSTKLVG